MKKMAASFSSKIMYYEVEHNKKLRFEPQIHFTSSTAKSKGTNKRASSLTMQIADQEKMQQIFNNPILSAELYQHDW